MSFKLYELTEMYEGIWDLANDEESDLDALEIALKGIEENIEVKAENTAKLIKSLEANVKVIQEEERRLAGKRRAMNNKIKGIKGYMEHQLKTMNINKIQGDLFTVALQNNPPSVRFIDEDLIPDEYKEETVTVKIPKKAILDDLKEGKEIAGTEMVQTKSLRIR